MIRIMFSVTSHASTHLVHNKLTHVRTHYNCARRSLSARLPQFSLFCFDLVLFAFLVCLPEWRTFHRCTAFYKYSTIDRYADAVIHKCDHHFCVRTNSSFETIDDAIWCEIINMCGILQASQQVVMACHFNVDLNSCCRPKTVRQFMKTRSLFLRSFSFSPSIWTSSVRVFVMMW